MKWNPDLRIWEEDEWLVGIYEQMWMARNAVEEWGRGRDWSNDRELQIIRYFRKRTKMFEPGEELTEDTDGVCEKIWLRYAEFDVIDDIPCCYQF